MTPEIDVIVRMHDFTRLDTLDRCLFSLSVVSDCVVHPYLLLQNPSDEDTDRICSVAGEFTWKNEVGCQIIGVEASRDRDIRSALLNEGIRAGRSRHLAFLDYDDVIYPHAYALLCACLSRGTMSVAFGEVLQVVADSDGGIVGRRHAYRGRNRLELFADNFCPINSYVVDRSRVHADTLYFDEDLALFEDYDFLLRLLCAHGADFSCMRYTIGEYWHYTDGRNSNPDVVVGNAARRDAWQEGLEEIQRRKKGYLVTLPMAELLAMQAAGTNP